MKFMLRIFTVLAIVLQSSMLAASSDSGDAKALSARIDELQREIAQLRQSIEMLKKLQPTVTTMMPDISERLHVMHFAGDAQDWALASHELQVLRGMIDKIRLVDPEKGTMANGFLLTNFNKLEAAIEHENRASFEQALEATVDSCNNCHVAVGSPSMKVVLDATDSLSLRHSHALEKSKKPGDHTHSH